MCDQCPEDRSNHAVPSRRSAILLGASVLGTVFADRAFAKEHKAPPKPQNVLAPDAALKRLMDGNARYVDGVTRRHDFKHEREALAGGQNPFAAVLSCADSRIAPEYAFDTGRGDLFVCRVAGNFAGTETIASMEYAVAVLNTPLILVLGHDACGAVDATLKAIKDDKPPPGHIPSLVDAIAPAAKAAMQQGGDTLDKAIRQNVIDNVAKLKAAAPILNAAVEQGKLKIAGGIYRLSTGTVDLIAQG
ncbi:carbonic anhydrase [Bradyrhizobium sp. WYCCWR 13023]|uniref:Carbonic anhydrase n=1 Tax=Bradyrhizobium zhengyangense TaxID=2911009 RepID=A0A9X1UHK4_9BRAD|nr:MULTISPECIES: carbonic anhydrase [Bradyrhizobium]MCG2628487.1 carbonic anhydrase [Bradyrhizobium zhengyangense]MCG2640118.1 carbonic anhydrase [Bradyrhizobium zhengyangense]MCG2665399.1 carbonic anhydrase [Bradyrhizobium zhengyangense]MDA9523422.1 carbonic anhydrase [Bradyrhizobium sp. CCBAU 11434]